MEHVICKDTANMTPDMFDSLIQDKMYVLDNKERWKAEYGCPLVIAVSNKQLIAHGPDIDELRHSLISIVNQSIIVSIHLLT